MSPPIIDYDLVTDTTVFVRWEPITSDLHTGALPITSYSLEWDQATGNWQSLKGELSDSLDLYMNVD
jgi:hypothetical protein